MKRNSPGEGWGRHPKEEPIEQGDLFSTIRLSNGEEKQSWWSLLDARKWLRSKLPDGIDCPCCGRFAKRYRRNIGVTTAKCLSAMWYLGPDGEWVFARDIVRRVGVEGNSHPTGMIGMLQHWGLVQAKENWEDPTKKHTGQWRITPSGREFVIGKISVPRYVFLTFNVADGFGDEKIWFQDLLKDNEFNYEDTMSSTRGMVNTSEDL